MLQFNVGDLEILQSPSYGKLHNFNILASVLACGGMSIWYGMVLCTTLNEVDLSQSTRSSLVFIGVAFPQTSY